MDENSSGEGTFGGPAGAGEDRWNVGLVTCVGACVGPDRRGTSGGPAYCSYEKKRRFMDENGT